MSLLQAAIAADNSNLAREQLRLKKQEMDNNLIKSGYDPNTMNVIPGSNADVEKATNQQALQLANALQGKLAAQDTDQAFVDYAETGDATYLQSALDKNPYLKQAWAARGVQTIANVDWQNDKRLIANMGFKPTEYDTEEKQAVLNKNVYKYYDGKEWNIGMLNNAVMETGAVTRLGPRRSSVFTNNYTNMRDMLAGPKTSANTAEGHKYEREITEAAQETGLPPNLIASMIQQESKGDSTAVSGKGAAGLMQLMPDTATELGVTDPADPRQNILAGAKYMAKMLEKHNGDLPTALAAYNAGPGAVAKHGGIPPYKETNDYIDKIMSSFRSGESYYRPELQEDNSKIAARMDDRIKTIQSFQRDQANALKGSSTEAETAKVSAALIEAQARKEANRVKASTDTLTTTQKDLREAEKQTNILLNNFGGEEAFLQTDFSDPKNFNKAWQQVVKINKLEGTTLTQDDRKNITDIRSLISLANPAAKLSASQTGIIDKPLAGVFKFLSDSPGDVNKAAAMAAFRNTLRHALFGSALTEGEINSFNEAFGETTQKLGPVLSQFKVALDQVQAKLDSTANLNNPYTMKVMIGADQEKLAAIRTALQQRVDYISGLVEKGSTGSKKPTGEATAIRKQNRPSLDSIFGGSN